MACFRSSLYLGMCHPAASLGPWAQLTRGMPAALGDPPGAAGLAASLAALIGHEHGVLSASTLHAFWDLASGLSAASDHVYVDTSSYALARWCAEQARGRGVPVTPFSTRDLSVLERLPSGGRRPVILSDGLCPAGPLDPPLSRLAAIAGRCGGLLVVDDTQALGLTGARPDQAQPLGVGGGGSRPRHALPAAHTLVIASLAKGFGSPVTVTTGPAHIVRRLASGPVGVHCSPPSAAVIAAGVAALHVNRVRGTALRARLTTLIRQLRAAALTAGVALRGGWFPLQTTAPLPRRRALQINDRMRSRGVEALLLRAPGDAARVGLIVTAAHHEGDLAEAVAALAGQRVPRVAA